MESIWKLLTLLENETPADADGNINILDGPVQNITKLVAFQEK